jgi:hypothetical protein
MSTNFQEKARRPQRSGAGGGRRYFAPEEHAAYAAFGFDASPAAQGGVARPDLKAYFARSRRVLWSGGGGGHPGGSGAGRGRDVAQRVLGDQPEGLDRVTERRASRRDLQPEDRPDLAQHTRDTRPRNPWLREFR